VGPAGAWWNRQSLDKPWRVAQEQRPTRSISSASTVRASTMTSLQSPALATAGAWRLVVCG
jgi:hypothetical protein